MERIKIGDFKARIEQATGKKLHKTSYARYRQIGLVPKNKQRKKYLHLNVNRWIQEIVDYEEKNLRGKQLFNQEVRGLPGNGYNLAFNLMRSKC